MEPRHPNLTGTNGANCNRTKQHLTLVYDYDIELREQRGLPKGRAHMPKATVNTQETTRIDLETCPGGYVELKRMSYGEFLKRRDMISEMSFKGEGKNTEATMKMVNEAVAKFEFATCIVDHNLEDENDKQLDFRAGRTFSMLDPRIGEEISSHIDKMNKWDENKDENDPLPLSEDE